MYESPSSSTPTQGSNRISCVYPFVRVPKGHDCSLIFHASQRCLFSFSVEETRRYLGASIFLLRVKPMSLQQGRLHTHTNHPRLVFLITSKLPCFHPPSRSCTLDRFGSHQSARNPHDRLTSVERRRLYTRDGACACERKAKERNIRRRLTKHTGPRAGETEVVCAATAEETAAEAGHGLRLSALQPCQVRHVQNQPRTRRGKARMFHLRCHVRLRRELVECTHRCVQRMDRRTGIRERPKTPHVPPESKGAPEIPCPGSKHRKEGSREEPELLCLDRCLHEARST